jgi:radical SAM protein with 4Fe4S-binding SPASM domain
MKAIIKPRISLEDRTPLQDVIPLATPFVLFIDPSNVCNFRCKFCPSGDKKKIRASGRNQKIMSYDLYTKIIDDLTYLPDKIKSIRLYKEGEPLLNKRLPEMIEYVKNKKVAERIEVTTNGAMLKPETNLKLVQAGLDRIVISIEALSSINYKEVSNVNIDFNGFIENIRHLYENRGNCSVCIKSTDIGINEQEKERFYEIFGEIADEIFIENITPVWPDFDLSAVKKHFQSGLYGQLVETVNVCSYIFYSLTINSDGSVSACFVDWGHKIIVGDIKSETFTDIWNGKKLRELRKQHLNTSRYNHQVCGHCGQLSFGSPDNIDSHADQLLKRLSNEEEE